MHGQQKQSKLPWKLSTISSLLAWINAPHKTHSEHVSFYQYLFWGTQYKKNSNPTLILETANIELCVLL